MPRNRDVAEKMISFCDAHCHYHDAWLAPHRARVFADLASVGVGRAVVNGTCETDWPEVAALAKEFAVVLPECGAAAAIELAERIRKVTEAQPFVFNDKPFPVTVSLGIGVTPGGESISPEALLARADKNLYTAKQTGRNRVVS